MPNTVPTGASSQKVQPIVDVLFPDVQIKIWSLVVTVFGDLASRGHDSLSGAQLRALFEVMSIKPDALRVALHRLNKDGWIISERTGRNTDYRLSDFGIAETKKVWQRVYRPVRKLNRQWYVMVLPNPINITLPRTDSPVIKLAPQTYAVDKTCLSEHPDALAFPMQSSEIPDWVGEKYLNDDIDKACSALLAAFVNMPKPELIESDLERVAIRVLCVHQWRRIVLRNASLLHLNQFEQGSVRNCHDQIHQLLEDIPRDSAVKIMSDI